MEGKSSKQDTDPLGKIVAVTLLLLLTCIMAVQFALTIPSWRLRLSRIDLLEGVRLEDASARR